MRASVAPQKRMCDGADALVAVQAEVVQGQVSSRLSRSPAPRVIRSDSTEAMPGWLGRIVDAAGRHQEVERRRADVLHALGQQRQAVGEGVLMDFLWHGRILPH